MTKIPSVEEALAESKKPEVGRSAKLKNLQWLIGGVVVALAAIGIFNSTATRDQVDQAAIAEKDRMARLQASQVQTPVSPEEIEEAINGQKRYGVSEDGVPSSLAGGDKGKVKSTPVALPPVPGTEGSAQGYSGITTSSPTATDVQDKAVADLAKRDEQIRAAPILAITETSAAARGQNGLALPGVTPGTVTPQGANQPAALAAQLEEVKSRMASARSSSSQLESLRSQMGTGAAAGAGNPARAGTGAFGVGGGQSSDANARWIEGQSKATGDKTLVAERPAAPYLVGQGAIIPAVLVTEINSDMPGQLTAVVSIDIFDSIHGDQLLIPKGARLVGLYNNDVRAGQERVLAAFQRLVLPNGYSLDLMGMQSADAQGRSGLPGDDVNNHFFKMFAASFMTAGLASLLQSKTSNSVYVSGGGSVNPGISAAGQILVDLSKSINEQNTRIPPTITIKQGHKFNVIVNKDMVLSPYRS